MRVRARAGWLMVTALAAVAASLTAVPVAQAVPLESDVATKSVMPGYVMVPTKAGASMAGRIQNVATGRCLQMDAQQPYVYTMPCNGSIQQSWYWVNTPEPNYRELRSSYGDECLDASTITGRVYMQSCNGGGYQHWKYAGDREIIQSFQQRLDSNHEGSVYLSPYNGGNYQKWWA